MLKIYRIETRKGIGIYQGVYNNNFLPTGLKGTLYNMAVSHTCESTHPNFFQDYKKYNLDKLLPPGGMDGSYLHGCESLEGLKEWFESFFYVILKYAYIEVVTYKTRKIYCGNSKRQVIFRPIEGTRKVVPKTSLGLTTLSNSVYFL